MKQRRQNRLFILVIVTLSLFINQALSVESPPEYSILEQAQIPRYYQTVYQNKKVYYIPPNCCDIPSALFDENWQLICYPNGGFAGVTKTCPGFIFDKSNSIVIFKTNKKELTKQKTQVRE